MKNKMKIWQKIVLLLWVTMLSSAVVAVEKVTYIHTDALGSPMAGSDANGDLVWKEDYRPYGEPIRKQSKNQKLWYTGKEYDDDIGLSYYGARWYDPAIGRFMGVDPVEVDPENIHLFNRYAYANNNPYRYVDPDGNSPLEWGFIAGDVVSLGVNIGIGNYGAAAWDVVNIGLDIFAPPGVSQASHVFKGAALAGKATKSGKSFQTYTKTNPKTGQTYCGRTSGCGTPEQNVARRDSKHHMNKDGFGPAVLDKSSANSGAVRGREQQLIDAYGGARSTGGTSGNRINGISAKNQKRGSYMDQARKEFGG